MRTATLIVAAFLTTLLLTTETHASETDISTSDSTNNGRFPAFDPAALGRVPIEIVPSVRPIGDLNADGHVDGLDLTILLSYWGNCGTVLSTTDNEICTGDLNQNGQVDFDDLVILLSAWN